MRYPESRTPRLPVWSFARNTPTFVTGLALEEDYKWRSGTFYVGDILMIKPEREPYDIPT
jgi:hypothetical protein